MAKFYDESCQATCPEGQKAFSLLTTSDNACPDDFSDKAALRATFVRPKDFCAAEVIIIKIKTHMVYLPYVLEFSTNKPKRK